VKEPGKIPGTLQQAALLSSNTEEESDFVD
jgi:hypothetical protein